MIDSKEVLADFQFVASRVADFALKTEDIEIKRTKAKISIELDYNILKLVEQEEMHTCIVEFVVMVKAEAGTDLLFSIDLKMEGLFRGNPKKLTLNQFKEMAELNGVATLSQLSRAYIISVSAISGITPPIQLPMLNIYALREKKASRQEEE